ncbi:MAG: hypothetical protein LRY63_02980 [Nitrincola sp.]|nr:hypothetical protein [Nitrincola sp.]
MVIIFGCNFLYLKLLVKGKKHYTAFIRDVTQEREAREVITQTLEQALDAVVCIDEENKSRYLMRQLKNFGAIPGKRY